MLLAEREEDPEVAPPEAIPDEDEDVPEDAPEEPEEGEAEEGEFVFEDPDEAEELDLDDEEALLLFELPCAEEDVEDCDVEGEEDD